MLFNTNQSRKFSAGEHEQGVFRADRLNLALEEIDSIKRMLANMLPRVNAHARYEHRLGEIVDTPDTTDPDTGAPYADLTDARYYVRWSAPSRTIASGDQLEVEADTSDSEDPSPTSRGVIVATNLAEVLGSTHLLAVGAPVHVWTAVVEKDGDPTEHHFFSSGSGSSLFPVTVEKTGGADGSASTAASWTYTVRNLAGDTLGTVVAVTRPRPAGLMTFQSGSSGYGLAFYDGATLKLWDAGEVETTGACTS